MAITVVEYIREDGRNPYKSWFDGLDAQAAAKVATAILRLEMGNTSSVKWIGTIGEYRIDWGPGYRIYLARDGEAFIVLLGGGTKKRQQADIERAKALLVEYIVGRVQGPEGCDEAQRTEVKMALTRDFKETIIERVQRDPTFAGALLDEAATLFLNGEPHTARLILRDLVNATIGFEKLALETDKPSKSLHRMLSENGNPSMDNLAAIFSAVRKSLGVTLEAHAVKAA